MIYLTDEPEAQQVFQKTIESQVNLVSINPAKERETRVAQRKRDWFLNNTQKAYAINVPYCKKYEKTEKAKATRATWRAENKEKLREYHANYHLKRKGVK